MKGQETHHSVPREAMFWLNGKDGADPASRPTHVLNVRRNGQSTKCREYHVVTRMGGPHELGVFNNSVSAVERAMVERYFLCDVGGVFLPALQTKKRDWESKWLVRFRQKVVDEVRLFAVVLSLYEVVERYTGAKRRVYEAAHRSLLRRCLNRKDAHLRPFTKFEKQLLLKAPRIINPRSPRYNLVLGRYLKAAEKYYFNAINVAWGEHTGHTVIKGMNVFESATVMKAKWDRFRNPVAIGLDASKFDMHVSVEALLYEHSFYNRTFNSSELKTLLSMQVYNKGKAYCKDGEVEFRMPGTRSSGDLNTSLGNCIIMCALIWAMCQELGIDAELANNGDDCVLFVESEHLKAVLDFVPDYFRKYGFRMTVEDPVYEFEKVEFCQSRPVQLKTGWAMVRNVRTCLKKDPMCLIPVQNDKVWRKWLGAVGECGLASVPGCPILQSFYGAFLRSGCKTNQRFKSGLFKNTGVLERGAGVGKRDDEITDAARASFFRATGITPDYQIAVEAYYEKLEIGGLDELLFGSGVAEVAPPVFLRHL